MPINAFIDAYQNLPVKWWFMAQIVLFAIAAGIAVHGAGETIVNVANTHVASGAPHPAYNIVLAFTDANARLAYLTTAVVLLWLGTVTYLAAIFVNTNGWLSIIVEECYHRLRNKPGNVEQPDDAEWDYAPQQLPERKQISINPSYDDSKRSHRIARRIVKTVETIFEVVSNSPPKGIHNGWSATIRMVILAATVALLTYGMGDMLFHTAAYDVVNQSPHNWAVILYTLEQGNANLPFIAGALTFMIAFSLPIISTAIIKTAGIIIPAVCAIILLAVYLMFVYQEVTRRLRKQAPKTDGDQIQNP